MEKQMEKHLFALAQATLRDLEVNEDYGYGIGLDGKRPFGNSGYAALLDTLKEAGVKVPDIEHEDMGEYYEYARELWAELPGFIKNKCTLTLKE